MPHPVPQAGTGASIARGVGATCLQGAQHRVGVVQDAVEGVGHQVGHDPGVPCARIQHLEVARGGGEAGMAAVLRRCPLLRCPLSQVRGQACRPLSTSWDSKGMTY